MLVSFLGGPSSGKTTIAALVFAYLKNHNIPCELSPEYAREYIARLRLFRGDEPLELKDGHQVQMMSVQYDRDITQKVVCGEGVYVISDTSPLCAMLYLKDWHKKWNCNLSSSAVFATQVAHATDHLFVIRGAKFSDAKDPNRVHSRKQAREASGRITDVLNLVKSSLDKTNHIHYLQASRSSEYNAHVVLDRLGIRK